MIRRSKIIAVERPKTPPLLAFGAHPDDLEFACGAILAKEFRTGRPVHMVVCSRGESATHGTAKERQREAKNAAEILGASLSFIELDGDARLEVRCAHALKIAGVIRRERPAVVLAPSPVENQHPDHFRLAQLIRDGARLARYGGVKELRGARPHAIEHLLFYALGPESEPRDISPILVDVSDPALVVTWTAAMEAHATQVKNRDYIEFQLARARVQGMRAGVSHAIALYPNDPPLIDALAQLGRGARQF